jgi:hypothetical protein
MSASINPTRTGPICMQFGITYFHGHTAQTRRFYLLYINVKLLCICITNIIFFIPSNRGWLRHCATRRKVAGSIPDGASGIFHWHNPSGSTIALRSTKPLTEMRTRNISWWGGGGRCVGVTLPLSCADCLEIWEPQPPATLRACPGL